MKGNALAALVAAALLVAGHGASARTESGGSTGSPAIVVPECLLTGSQRPDAPIDVKFVTAPDAAVDLASLHIWVHRFIGWVDVTDRLMTHPHVRVSGWGIHFDGGVLAAGEHQVRLLFHDMKGRVAEATEIIRIAAGGGLS
jgi:hypothetical protein